MSDSVVNSNDVNAVELALIGGIGLGVCSLMKITLSGRVLGISGSVRGVVRNITGLEEIHTDKGKSVFFQRLAFVFGFCIAAYVCRIIYPQRLESVPLPGEFLPVSFLGGLMIGIGSSFMNGCTSGHSITGCSKFSVRSFVATLLYMGSGFITATTLNVSQFISKTKTTKTISNNMIEVYGYNINPAAPAVACFVPVILLWLFGTLKIFKNQIVNAIGRTLKKTHDQQQEDFNMQRKEDQLSKLLEKQQQEREKGLNFANMLFDFYLEMLAGFGFGLCLVISGMNRPGNVMSFLDLSGFFKAGALPWNPNLILVMGGAHLIQTPALWMFIRKHVNNDICKVDSNSLPAFGIDRILITGAILFGVGWGISGMCPGPGLILLFADCDTTYSRCHGIAFVIAMLLGMYLTSLYSLKKSSKSKKD